MHIRTREAMRRYDAGEASPNEVWRAFAIDTADRNDAKQLSSTFGSTEVGAVMCKQDEECFRRWIAHQEREAWERGAKQLGLL